MSHALAGVSRRRLDHGALNAVLLPHVLAFNAPAVASRYEAIKRELGWPAGTDLADAMVRLRERLALPARLGEFGVGSRDIERAAVFAESDHANRTNPRRADASDYLAIMRAAL